MKKAILAAVSCFALLAVFPACDQHSWETSKDGKTIGPAELFKPHGDHGGDAKPSGGDEGKGS